jgi:hypothetical protein
LVASSRQQDPSKPDDEGRSGGEENEQQSHNPTLVTGERSKIIVGWFFPFHQHLEAYYKKPGPCSESVWLLSTESDARISDGREADSPPDPFNIGCSWRRLRSTLFLLYHCLLCWRAKAMQTIYVSNHGDDKNNGLTQESAVRSWKRYMTLSRGNHELHLMEGDVTFQRLVEESQAGKRVPYGV